MTETMTRDAQLDAAAQTLMNLTNGWMWEYTAEWIAYAQAIVDGRLDPATATDDDVAALTYTDWQGTDYTVSEPGLARGTLRCLAEGKFTDHNDGRFVSDDIYAVGLYVEDLDARLTLKELETLLGGDQQAAARLVVHALTGQRYTPTYSPAGSFRFGDDRDHPADALDADTVQGIGLDPTGRDGDPRFPYTEASLSGEERVRLAAYRGEFGGMLPLRSLTAARDFGRRVAADVSLDTEGLRLSDAVRAVAGAAGSSEPRANAAAGEAFFVLRNRQAEAHVAGTWCPEGPAGCAFCSEVKRRAVTLPTSNRVG